MIGKRLGHFEIRSHLGSGGMGDVYEAADLTLGRSVAIKVLPEGFVDDPERLLRFRREARLLAALNHPNIATLHGMEESEGRVFLVMELVPGETLAQRIRLGSISAAEAGRLLLQIAEALEAAHDKGIIHRDLKPANIKLMPGGAVKVLDFGLARMQAPTEAAEAESATRMTAASSPGVVIGTPAYMAPEQAKGLDAGRAADVWGFGCVAYEMLTGRRAFHGESAAEILAGVLKSEPDWTALPPETPGPLRRLLRRCLTKDLRSRFHDIADVRIELEDSLQQGDTGPISPAKSRKRGGWAVALVVIVAAVAIALFRPAAPAPLMSVVDIATPPAADRISLALSPNGREAAFTALTEDGQFLWVRSLDSDTARKLPGTEGAALPFWAPDQHAIGFFAQSKLQRIDLDTGAVQVIASATLKPSGATWNRDGVILFSPSFYDGIFRVHESGGPVTRLLSSGVAPKFLSDGRRFLFHPARGVSVSDLDGSPPVPLIPDVALAYPGLPGHLAFIRERALFVQAFDPERLALTGTPSRIAQEVAVSTDSFNAAVAASEAGILAYRISPSDDGRSVALMWFDRSGRELSRVGDNGGFNPNLSPDGRYVAVNRRGNSGGIWLIDTKTGTASRLISDGSMAPLFSPRDNTIVFSSSRTRRISLYKTAIDAAGDRLFLETTDPLLASDWQRLPQGDYLLYRRNPGGSNFNIGAVPMRGADPAGDSIEVLATGAQERDAQFAPNGQWIAYESNSSGTPEIYLHPFPGPGRQIPVSRGGGVQVRWNPNGRELFYVALDGHLMAVPIRFSPDGKTVESGDPQRLFRTRMGQIIQGADRQQYAVSADGQRFLISTVADQAPIHLILNWKPRGD